MTTSNTRFFHMSRVLIGAWVKFNVEHANTSCPTIGKVLGYCDGRMMLESAIDGKVYGYRHHQISADGQFGMVEKV